MASSAQTKRGAGGPLPFASAMGQRLLGGFGRSLLRLLGNNRYEGAAADALMELHRAAFEREQRVVAAHPDPVARMKLGAALAHDDVAGQHDLAAELLDPEPLAGAVAAVARGAACLFVCHLEPLRPLSFR